MRNRQQNKVDNSINPKLNTTYLYLCRHGQSYYNVEGKLQGQIESSLTCWGKEQSSLLARSSKQWNISNVISSPLGRAQQTAEICAQALNLTVEVQPGFEERHYGAWQGLPISQLPAFEQFKQRCYSQVELTPCDGAESTATVRTRITNQLKLLSQRHINGNVLLISHGDAIDCLLSLYTTPKTMKNCQHLRLVKVAGNFVLHTP